MAIFFAAHSQCLRSEEVLAMMPFYKIWENPSANRRDHAEPRQAAGSISGALEAAGSMHTAVESPLPPGLLQTRADGGPMRRHGLNAGCRC